MSERLDRKRLAMAGIAIFGGCISGALGQPLIHGNEAAINVIVTVFSILAGFLVAITTILGDPSALLPGSWRIAAKQRTAIHSKLLRQKWLFYIYLATLGLIFVTMLIKDSHPLVTVWMERLYLGLATAGFIWSLRLPTTLMAIQTERIDAAIEARQKAVGIQTPPGP